MCRRRRHEGLQGRARRLGGAGQGFLRRRPALEHVRDDGDPWATRRCAATANYHFCPYTIPLLLDAGGNVLPREGVQTGTSGLFDLLAETYWGGFITGDGSRCTGRMTATAAGGAHASSETSRGSPSSRAAMTRSPAPAPSEAYSEFMEYVSSDLKGGSTMTCSRPHRRKPRCRHPAVVRGRVIEPGEDSVEFGGRVGARFRTPDPRRYASQIGAGRRRRAARSPGDADRLRSSSSWPSWVVVLRLTRIR